MSRILIVDDEDSILKSLKRVLRLAPCTYGTKNYTLEIADFNSPAAALEAARHEEFDLFMSDYRMPGMDGIEFLKAAKAIQPDAARLILSGYADLNALVRAVNEVGTTTRAVPAPIRPECCSRSSSAPTPKASSVAGALSACAANTSPSSR